MEKKFYVFVVLAILWSYFPATAQWVKTNDGIGGGNIKSLAVSGSTIFAGISAAETGLNTAGVFISANNGTTWAPVNSSPFSTGLVNSSVVNCLLASGAKLFAGTNGGVFLSNDNGLTWADVSAGLTSTWITALAISGSDLFAATAGGGVFRSSNNGTTWTAVNTGLTSNVALSLLVSGTNLFVGTALGVFVTTNNGASWASANTGLPESVRTFVAVGSNLFAGTQASGVFLSTNTGASWSAVSTGLTNLSVNCLTENSADLYAGTAGGGIFRSTNLGATWSPVNNGVNNKTINALVASGAGIFAGTPSGVFFSPTNGVTWNTVSTGINAVAKTYLVSGANTFVGVNGGVFLSTDGGVTWSAVNNGLTNTDVWSLVQSGTNLFVGTSGGVFISSNNGASWTPVSTGLTNLVVNALAVSGSRIFAGTSTGVFVSSDNGATWSSANNGLFNPNIRSMIAVGTSVFAGNNGGGYGIFRSTDDGASWTPVNSGLTSSFVRTFVAIGSDVYAGTSSGVFTTANNGGSWSAASNGLLNPQVYSMAVDGNVLFAGCGNGVHASTDNGANWGNISTSLSGIIAPTAIAVRDSKVMAGMPSIGLWARPQADFLPTITSFTPGNGVPGTVVTITGTAFSSTPGDNAVSFNGTSATVSSSTPTSITATVQAGTTTGKISVVVNSLSVTSASNFTINGSPPTISGFLPATGSVGTTVTIQGTNFSTTPGNNLVSFNGTPATVTAATATSLTVAVPNGATTGVVSVTVSSQTATSATNFTVTVSAPTISGFLPTSGSVGSTVTVEGTNFSTTPNNNQVSFNGTLATVTAATATSLTVTVPSGATSGVISVTTNSFTATSLTNFTVIPPAPTISSFTPASGPVGTAVSITGNNFSTTPANNGVSFNGTAATVTASTLTSLDVVVPAGATTGAIKVTTNAATATSASSFVVIDPPVITSFAPVKGPGGTVVTITGLNFSTTPANNVVRFNGVVATVTAATSTSITVTVPSGATSGNISVTTNALIATSSSTFTMLFPPSIVSFTPASGSPGTTVTISGIFFDTTPTGNDVRFNGTASTVTASTASSITATVPVGATTGFISVTVNALTATSTTAFTVTAAPDTTAPVVANATATTVIQGEDVPVSSLFTDTQSGIASANLLYRSIAAGGNFTSVAMVKGTGENYTQTIPASAVGELGVEYTFDVTNGVGLKNEATLYSIKVTIPGDGLVIPYESAGTEVSNYRIVAVPLDLPAKSVGAVFNELGGVDDSKWRMFQFRNGTNQELNLTSAINAGSGYWLIAAEDPGVIHSGPGATVASSSSAPFTIDLATGWNQIGNPYPFNISWADVQAANPSLPGLRKYDGTFVDGTVLNKMEGGFVFVPAARTIAIPVKKNDAINTGRTVVQDIPLRNPLSQKNWQVNLNLNQGERKNKIAAFGMHEEASYDYDVHDGISMPRFFGEWLEVNYKTSERSMSLCKDIVPPSENYMWDFSVDSSDPDQPMTFTWDNSYFGSDAPSLYLWDEVQQWMIDMRTEDHYSFSSNVSSRFRVVFGSEAFVRETLKVLDVVLHDVWPNPAATSDDINVSFRLPDSVGEMPVTVSVYNSAGKKLWIHQQVYPSGYHELIWRTNESPGLFVVVLTAGNVTKQRRVILKN